MLKAQPEVARYLHEAHAITRGQLEALEAAGALVVAGAYSAANALLEQAPGAGLDRTTPLDVVALSRARKQVIQALTGTAHAAAIAHFDALSLAQREVSEWAETVFVRRVTRLVRLVELDAPASIMESEIELLRETMLRLDSLMARPDTDEPRFLPDEEIARFSDGRFALSLGTFTAVLDDVAEFHREERPADGSEVFALGGPLLEIDFANPPKALLERAIEQRGVWDEQEERACAPQQPYGPWLEWMVLEDADDIDVVRENCAGCHGTAMWTNSRVFWTPNEANNGAAGALRTTNYTAMAAFPAALNPPSAGAGRTASLRFPAGAAAGANDQIQCVLRAVGTFPASGTVATLPAGSPVAALEVRANMTTAAQGLSGFNPPALLGGVAGAPYFHAGNARTMEEVFDPAFNAHAQALSENFLLSGDRATQVRQLVAFLLSIDESTAAPATPTLPYPFLLCPNSL